MSQVQITGVEEIIRNFSLKAKKVKTVEKTAREAGAQVIKRELERNTPKSDEGGDHLKDTIGISGARTDKETGDKYTAVGWGKDNAWRVHFPEFGTIYQSPQGFVTKSVNNAKDEVERAMISQVKRALR